MNKKILAWLITLCALGLGGTAAYYSVVGLSKLFIGISTSVLIMASFLELSKLTLAAFLHSYWDKILRIQKIYYILSIILLSMITSAGIYGALSGGYQTTATQSEIVDKQVTALETKKGLYKQNRDNILKEKQSLAELKVTLSKGSTTQYTDKKGNLVVRSNNATIRNIESANRSDENLSTKLDVINDSIFSLENKILEVKTKGDAASELGSLKYLSELTGVEMNRIVNWLLLVIIFVFDPLAISLIIAANVAFVQLSKTSINELTKEDKEWLEADLLDDETNKNLSTNPEIKNLDLNRDGIITEEELEQFTKSLRELEKIHNENNYDFQWKKDKAAQEIKSIKKILSSQPKNEKDNENTKTYF